MLRSGSLAWWRSPVVYGREFGPDLDFVSRHCGLTQAEVIALHNAGEYPIYMMGLPWVPLPGSGMDRRLACPRLETPHTLIPAGSVGIAGEQTRIYHSSHLAGGASSGGLRCACSTSNTTRPTLPAGSGRCGAVYARRKVAEWHSG
jgi:KipI family sensor histidine kinase inhibitor